MPESHTSSSLARCNKKRCRVLYVLVRSSRSSRVADFSCCASYEKGERGGRPLSRPANHASPSLLLASGASLPASLPVLGCRPCHSEECSMLSHCFTAFSVSRCTLGAAVQRTRGIVAGFAGLVLLGRLNCQLSTRVCRTLTPLVAQHGGLSHLRTPDGGFVRLSTGVLPPTHPFVRVSYVLSDCNPISAVILKSETCDTCNILTLERLPQIFRGDPATEPATDPGK